jgi:regulator of cell morphogenesis and NO signaling
MKHDDLAIAPLIGCVLTPHHRLLRKEASRAADLFGSVVLEQRPPLCHTLLPLHRLFQELRGELEEHLRLQESLFPLLLELECDSGASPAVSDLEDVSEGLRLLTYGQALLAALLEEMRELTHGFAAPSDACECYGELLEVLAGIQLEMKSEIRLETNLLREAGKFLADARRSLGRGQVCNRGGRNLSMA